MLWRCFAFGKTDHLPVFGNPLLAGEIPCWFERFVYDPSPGARIQFNHPETHEEGDDFS